MVHIVTMSIVNTMSIIKVFVQVNKQVFVMILHFNVIALKKITLYQLELIVLLIWLLVVVLFRIGYY